MVVAASEAGRGLRIASPDKFKAPSAPPSTKTVWSQRCLQFCPFSILTSLGSLVTPAQSPPPVIPPPEPPLPPPVPLLDRPSLEAVSLKLYEDRSSGWAKDAAPVGASSLDEVVDELRPPLEQASFWSTR